MTFTRDLDEQQTEAAQVLASVMCDAWPSGKDSLTDEDREMIFTFARHLVRGGLVFAEKHHSYGPRNIAASGEVGVAVRLADKSARLMNMRGKSSNVESVADTAGDIGNYGFILRMIQDGEWPGVVHGWALSD